MAIDLAELFYKQKGLCYWCKSAMHLDGGNDPKAATREHLVPQSRGGKAFVKKAGRKQRNIVAACRKCNNSRGNMDAHAFKSVMRPHIS